MEGGGVSGAEVNEPSQDGGYCQGGPGGILLGREVMA